MRILAISVCALCLVACGRNGGPGADAHVSAVPSMQLQRAEWSLPSPLGAAQPDLVASPDGSVLLSWVEADGSGDAMKFSRWQDGSWSEPQAIARGDNWFVNWADTPHIAIASDGALWAHWLEKSAAATYAYDVVMARSADDGAHWSQPIRVNDDGTPTEHGFVSLWPTSEGGIGVAWLDGRETGAGGHEDHKGHENHGGAMSLRAARFDAQMQRRDEHRIDASTCDCCQSTAALTDVGALLAYRDRSEDEIRDISVVRLGTDGWSAPRPVHADNWKIEGCPVNGPALAARGMNAAVAWFTAADNSPRVGLARSMDAGTTFSAPVWVDQGEAVQGRVDVALDSERTWVLWTREDANGQSLHLAAYGADRSQPLARMEVARLHGHGRATGFARLLASNGELFVVWTDVIDKKPRLFGARIKL